MHHSSYLLYAHSRDGHDPQAWEPYPNHAALVSRLSAGYAEAADLAAEGRLTGLVHDDGKTPRAWQCRRLGWDPVTARLLGGGQRHGHAAAGALRLILARCTDRNVIGAVLGHHAGLVNADEVPGHVGAQLGGDLAALRAEYAQLERAGHLPPVILPPPRALDDLQGRLLYSALVDADRSATASFYDAAPVPAEAELDVAGALAALQARVAQLGRERTGRAAAVRARVLAQVVEASTGPRGLQSLTAPTGAGKTLSALMWALLQAEAHDLRRVVYVLPTTSVAEQVARELRVVLGDGAVLEHHCRVAPDRRRDHRAETWNVPVVVTTAVRLVETLVAVHPGDARRLHRLARSAVILDEVQALPLPALVPVLELLRDVVDRAGASALLMTATPPDYVTLAQLGAGVAVRELLRDVPALFRDLCRVNFRWCGERTVEGAAALVRDAVAAPPPGGVPGQGMVVLNTRRAARAVHAALRAQGVDALLLSGSRVPRERRVVLDAVRARLDAGVPCVLVATQLVEAGVDFDFPVVLRALGPLESLIQVAGRANREGRLERGEVLVFDLQGPLPLGDYGIRVERARLYARDHDLNEPETYRRYFQVLAHDLRSHHRAVLEQVRAARRDSAHRTLSGLLRVIDDAGATVVCDADVCVRELSSRALQDISVSVSEGEARRLVAAGLAVEVVGYDRLLQVRPGVYSPEFGLPGAHDPAC